MLRIGTWAVGILLVLLIAARLYLPVYLRHYVTRVLNQNPEYSSSLVDITVHLWRGAYRIERVRIEKMNGKVPVPLFYATGVDLSVQWRELIHGALVGEVELEDPELNFVHAPSHAASQSGQEGNWTDTVKKLFPLRINRFAVSNGTIHYRDFNTSPEVDLKLTEVNGEARNLTNSEKISKTLVSTFDYHANVEKETPLHLQGELNPFAEDPTFATSFELKNLDVTKLNQLLRAYANADAHRGDISIYAQLKSDHEKISGEIKPLIKNLELIEWKKDASHPFKLIWKGILASIAELFTNQRKDQIALVIPLSGEFKDPSMHGWSSFMSLLENAFIKALEPGLADLEKQSLESSK